MLLFLPIIPILLGALGGVSIVAMISAILYFFSGKKTLLTGPQASGKTTFLQYLSKDKIPSAPSGAPRAYKVKEALFDVVTDFSGADAWLSYRFDEFIEEHDYILFFFDVSEFIRDSKYRMNTSARLKMIYEHITTQKVLLIGTHIDQVKGNYNNEVEHFFSGQIYQDLLKRIVYIDTTNKKCVKTILTELKK